jgi:hydrogenase expression/formation protein HypC
MCLAIPAQVVLISDARMAEVDIHGVSRTVSLDLTPDAAVGSWVLIHAGFAIQVVDEQFAAESWDLIQQIQWIDDGVEAPETDTAASA